MLITHEEHRSFQRMTLNLPISISKGALHTHAICRDLSSTGMAITFTDPHLHTGDCVHVTLQTEDKRFPPLQAEATLLRVEKNQHGFSGALVFTEMA